ncbi:DUF1641 domain-containing protein [Desulfosediminicola flagellatus]|uniref:DUF1641 domain-containing protein n=1 Tax=Desulfosediminicola flagellatus TaxID=2569541 RepID=UPI0010AC2C18|nr:DUF1641 domain-containing protein [Desulfosediminicola flagellatus]
MNEALILEKLDNLSSEIQSLKSEVQTLKEAKQAPASSAQPAQPAAAPLLAAFEGKYNEKDLNNLVENLLVGVNDINSMFFKMRAGNELARDIEPIAYQVYPEVIKFCSELEGQVTVDDVVALLRNVITAVPALNESVGYLKAGIELTDDLMPVAQILYPKVITILNEIQLAIEKSNGLIKVAGSAANSAMKISLTDTQAEEIGKIIEGIDFSNIKPVSPIGAVKQLMDKDVQQSLGAAFMVLQAMGACVQAIQKK